MPNGLSVKLSKMNDICHAKKMPAEYANGICGMCERGVRLCERDVCMCERDVCRDVRYLCVICALLINKLNDLFKSNSDAFGHLIFDFD